MIRRAPLHGILGAALMVVTSTPVKAKAATSGDIRHVRTTAYSGAHGGHLNAHGARLHSGSAAADWSRFPYGTRFRVRGRSEVFTIDDYGSALVGTNTIDLYMPSRGSMNRWGVRQIDIELIEMGDYQKSRDILKSRARHSTCARRMLHALERR